MAELHSAHFEWRTSTRSAAKDCMEVAFDGTMVLVRNSRDPSGPVLTFTPSAWSSFLRGVRTGEFDRSSPR